MALLFTYNDCEDTRLRDIRLFDTDDDQYPAGWVTVGTDIKSSRPDRDAFLSNLWVAKEYRHKHGIARPLMMEAERAMKEMGFRVATLHVRTKNKHAQEFYGRMGWKFQHTLAPRMFGAWRAWRPTMMVYQKLLTGYEHA